MTRNTVKLGLAALVAGGMGLGSLAPAAGAADG